MTITLTYAWWWIPTIITVIAMAAPVVFSTGEGFGAGIQFILLLVPALLVISVVWILGAIFK